MNTIKHIAIAGVALAVMCISAVPFVAVSSKADVGGSTGTEVRGIRIHSHNDYAQKRPFWGAYEAGADSIEADVFLEGGELIVAHSRRNLKSENTLRRLYLEPLRSVFKKNGGRARANGKPLQLVIDLKDGKPALDALLSMIEREGFRACFDTANNPSAVRLSVGGGISRIKDFLSYPDYVFFSVPSSRELDEVQYKRVSWISDHARIYTKWKSGEMADADKKKIRDAAARAHAKGVPYRLWGFPDHAEAWQISRELGLDYINTDRPSAVAAFLKAPEPISLPHAKSAKCAKEHIDEPELLLKGRTLTDVQTNEISGNAIGTHMRPRNMVGFNKTMLPAADGKPARLRVEMQMMDSYHLKCIVLELTDGADGVHGRAVDARYVLTKEHGLGWKFVNADGSLNGTAHPLVTNPKGAGYGIEDLTLVPREIDVGGGRDEARSSCDAQQIETDARRIVTVWAPGLGDYAARVWSGLVAGYYLPRLRMASEGRGDEIDAWQRKWIEERIPIPPPATGWTCEKLVDEVFNAS